MLRSWLIAAVLLALVAPAAALASGRDVIKDCAEDGVIDGDYSEREYEQAQNELPSDIDEYTDCREAIRGELAPGGGKGPRSGGPGDPALTTESGALASSPDDIAALGEIERSAESGDAPSVSVGGERVTPGDPSGGKLLGLGGTGNEMPAPMLSALVLLLLGAAAGTYLLARRGLPAPVAARLGRTREAVARLLRR